jgi:hypothetical protein
VLCLKTLFSISIVTVRKAQHAISSIHEDAKSSTLPLESIAGHVRLVKLPIMCTKRQSATDHQKQTADDEVSARDGVEPTNHTTVMPSVVFKPSSDM